MHPCRRGARDLNKFESGIRRDGRVEKTGCLKACVQNERVAQDLKEESLPYQGAGAAAGKYMLKEREAVQAGTSIAAREEKGQFPGPAVGSGQ